MISPLPGWHADLRQSGLLMFPPEGEDAGFIRYTEQCRPLRSMCDILESLAAPDDYEMGDVSASEHFATVEGEHVAVVTISGTLAGEPVERTVGCVFADDFYAMTIGVALRRDQFARFRATVRELVEHDTFMFGVRRRRFVHAAPESWHGFFVGSMHTKWTPLDYPRTAALLTVYPALPAPAGEGEHAETFVREQAKQIGGRNLTHRGWATAASGLSGPWFEVIVGTDDIIVHDFVVLEDGRYIYPIVLETVADQRANAVSTLWQVVESVEAIPERDGPTAQTCADVLAHWVD